MFQIIWQHYQKEPTKGEKFKFICR